MVFVPCACLFWGPTFETCTVNILVFIILTVIPTEKSVGSYSVALKIWHISSPFDISKVVLRYWAVLWNSKESNKDYWLCCWVFFWEPEIDTSCSEKWEESIDWACFSEETYGIRKSLGSQRASQCRKRAKTAKVFVGNERRTVWGLRVLPHELLWMGAQPRRQRWRRAVSAAAIRSTAGEYKTKLTVVWAHVMKC